MSAGATLTSLHPSAPKVLGNGKISLDETICTYTATQVIYQRQACRCFAKTASMALVWK
jgi:hypothetical protein